MVSSSSTSAWQSRFLPILVLIFLGLVIFFVSATVKQLHDLQDKVATAPEISLDEETRLLSGAVTSSVQGIDLQQSTLGILAKLESNTLARRYHLAQVTLMSRMWARYLGFVTGMILAFVGSIFILGKIREASSTVHLDASFAKFAVISSSPGIIFAVLGSALMLATILTNPEIKVNDGNIYLANVTVQEELVRSGGPIAPAVPGTKSPKPILDAIKKTPTE